MIRSRYVRRQRLAVVASALLILLALAHSAAESKLSLEGAPQYAPHAEVSGTIRVWGHGAWGRDFMEELVKGWETEFQKYQPGIRFDNHLLGTATAMGALYTGTGDIAILGREVRPSELDAFQRVMGHPPLAVNLVAGSFNVPNKDFALGIFVNKANPLRHLTMQQLGDVFGCAQRERHEIRTWGDLGVKGSWASRPIHVYGYQVRRGFGVYFDQVVLGGSGQWSCHYTEIGKEKNPDGSIRDDGQVIVDTVASDPDAIAFSGMAFTNSGAKVLALAQSAAGPYVLPTPQAVFNRTYPLYRVLTGFVDLEPGASLDPKMHEFLLYILSRQGQGFVLATGGYLPLNVRVIHNEREKLR